MSTFKNNMHLSNRILKEDGILLGVGVLLGTGLGVMFGIMVGNIILGVIAGIGFGAALDYVYENMRDREL